MKMLRNLRHHVGKMCVMSALAVASPTTLAAEWVDAKITSLSTSPVGSPAPYALLFTIDKNAAGCVASQNWLFWRPAAFPGTESEVLQRQLAQTRAVVANLQLAWVMGKRVVVFVTDVNASGMCEASNWMAVLD